MNYSFDITDTEAKNIVIPTRYPLLLPEYFRDNPEQQSVFYQNLAMVEYKSDGLTEKVPIEVSGLLLIHVISGIKTLISDSDKIEIYEGESVLISRGSYFMGEKAMANGNFYRSFLIFFQPAFLEEIIQENDIENDKKSSTAKKYLVMKNPEQTKIVSEIAMFLKESLSGQNRNLKPLMPLKAKELLLRLEASSNAPDVRKILSLYKTQNRPDLSNYMLKHYTDPGTALDFASRTLRSPGTFNREFHVAFGISPAKWLTQKRLSRAAVLLKTTHLSVTEIALNVGYETLNRFIEMFRRHYETTPNQFRKNRTKS